MKLLHLYFILFKLIIALQLALILFKKEQDKNPIFVISDALFKISLGLFLIFFFNLNDHPSIEFIDRLLINIAGYILIYDVVKSGDF